MPKSAFPGGRSGYSGSDIHVCTLQDTIDENAHRKEH